MGERVVWIERGCIECFWCQQLDARVFGRGHHGTVINGAIRLDRITDDNRIARSAIDPAVLPAEDSEFLAFIADGCPVQVIRLAGDWSAFGFADPAIDFAGHSTHAVSRRTTDEMHVQGPI